MRNEVLPIPETGIQITGISRIAEKTGLFLLLLCTLIIMVTWLNFATQAEIKALEVKSYTLKMQTFHLKRDNIALLEQISRACFSAGNEGFFRPADWEVIARGP